MSTKDALALMELIDAMSTNWNLDALIEALDAASGTEG